MDIPDSYFSHFRAFGFPPKSPYSATAVPYIFNLVHLTGAYMGDTRSLNAVAMQDAAINQIALVAGFIGDYFISDTDVQTNIGEDARADENKRRTTGQQATKRKSPARLGGYKKRRRDSCRASQVKIQESGRSACPPKGGEHCRVAPQVFLD